MRKLAKGFKAYRCSCDGPGGILDRVVCSRSKKDALDTMTGILERGGEDPEEYEILADEISPEDLFDDQTNEDDSSPSSPPNPASPDDSDSETKDQ